MYLFIYIKKAEKVNIYWIYELVAQRLEMIFSIYWSGLHRLQEVRWFTIFAFSTAVSNNPLLDCSFCRLKLLFFLILKLLAISMWFLRDISILPSASHVIDSSNLWGSSSRSKARNVGSAIHMAEKVWTQLKKSKSQKAG